MTKAGKKIIKGAKEASDYAKNFAPGTYGCHEALHMTSFMIDVIEDSLIDHRSISVNPQWRKLASDAQDKLFQLYQSIASKHLKEK